jgi:hypothetical protein
MKKTYFVVRIDEQTEDESPVIYNKNLFFGRNEDLNKSVRELLKWIAENPPTTPPNAISPQQVTPITGEKK